MQDQKFHLELIYSVNMGRYHFHPANELANKLLDLIKANKKCFSLREVNTLKSIGFTIEVISKPIQMTDLDGLTDSSMKRKKEPKS